MKKYTLVPISLKSTSKTTLIYAANMAKGIDNCEIILLTVINEEGERDMATKNLESKKTWISENFPDVKVKLLVVVGEVKSVIGEVAEQYGVEYTFIKPNKPNAWEKVVGSNTMDIIGEADDAPFLVVKDNLEYKDFKKIVVPIDGHVRSKQKLGAVAKLANEYGAKVFLFYNKEKDEFVRHATDANIRFAEKFLQNKGVEYEKHITDTSSVDVKQYLHDLLEYANTIHADLIAAVNFQRSFNLLSLPANNFENHLINNSYKIPVFMINPKVGVSRFS